MLERFDIDDRKGLEIVILSALLSFQDYSDEVHTNSTPLLGMPVLKGPKSPEEPPSPEVPPKPKRPGAEEIAAMQTGVLGEVTVAEDGSIEDYAQYCANLLEVRILPTGLSMSLNPFLGRQYALRCLAFGLC